MNFNLDAYKVTKDDYVKGDLINKGVIANVYEGIWKNLPVAVKVFCLKNLPSQLYQEVYPYFEIQHPNILRIFAINSVNQFSFLMEKMETSLAKKIEILVSQSVEFDLNQVEHIAESVANALSHLHDNQIIHRHLKPTNILFNNNEIKVSDFALNKLRYETSNKEFYKDEESVRWRSPESFFQGFKATEATDVYSFGVILWQLFALKNPYADTSEEVDVIKLLMRSTQEKIPKNCPSVWANLIQKCWALNPEERPTMKQIKAEIIEIKNARKNVGILKDLPKITDNIANIQNYIEGICISPSFESNK